MTVEAIVESIQALRVGPDERLIVRVDAGFLNDPDGSEGTNMIEELTKALVAIGLKDRVLVLAVDEELVDFVVVER